MSIEKNLKRAKKIIQNEDKLQRQERNTKVKDYIEMKMLKGYTREQATFMAKELIDNQ
tara:strand:+ start:2675 stop:2848 length:174 start_codon:yes stop_codon:yes gene_type:complete